MKQIVLLAMTILTINSCSGYNMKDQRELILNDFIDKIRNSTVTENQNILDSYFTEALNSNRRELRYEYLNLLRNKIKGSFIVLPYSLAVKDLKEIHLTQESTKQEDIYVIKIKDEIQYVYIKMKGDKIESISPMTKGNVIIGWM